jgi:hypothetical protein
LANPGQNLSNRSCWPLLPNVHASVVQSLLSKSQHFSFFLGGLTFTIGEAARFVERVNESIVDQIPEFEGFAGDFVNLSDVAATMDKFERLHNFVQQIAADIAMDLHCFVRHLAMTVSGDIRKADVSTAHLRALKTEFEKARHNLA